MVFVHIGKASRTDRRNRIGVARRQSGPSQFEFSEKWLESYEAPDRRKQELLRELRGAYDKFREHMTRKLLETGVSKQMVDERVRKMVEVIISEHNQELLPDSDTEE